MRVVFDMTPAHLNPAGTGHYARALLRELTGEGTLDVRTTEATRRRPRGITGRVAIGIQRELAYYPMLLDRRAREMRADVVHVPAGLGPLRPRTPLVVTIHDVLPLSHPEYFTRALLAHARVLLPRVARAAARVITVSEHARRQILGAFGLEESRVVAIHNGVSERFAPREVDDESLERRFGLRRPYVLSTGTLEPRKNLRTVLAAMRALPPEVTLAVAGGTGWRAEAIDLELDRSPSRVRRLGFVSDDGLAELYAGAACFVFPSLGEGFGLPPLEAMACGAPVVCSDRTSLPEVVGDAAVLVDAEDASALAAAVRRVIDDRGLAQDLRARGLARARMFTWRSAAQRTREVYAQAAE